MSDRQSLRSACKKIDAWVKFISEIPGTVKKAKRALWEQLAPHRLAWCVPQRVLLHKGAVGTGTCQSLTHALGAKISTTAGANLAQA
eukprot:1161828-Pelagomonas_calceolata.AAC.7